MIYHCLLLVGLGVWGSMFFVGDGIFWCVFGGDGVYCLGWEKLI